MIWLALGNSFVRRTKDLAQSHQTLFPPWGKTGRDYYACSYAYALISGQIKLWIYLYMRISGQVFFLLSVSLACYTLSRKNKLNNIIIRALGNTWRYNFYIGMQGSMQLEKGWFRIFDLHHYIKHTPSPICSFAVLCARAREKRGIPVLHAHIWRPLPDLLKTAL